MTQNRRKNVKRKKSRFLIGKKMVSIVLALLLALFSFSGCSSGGGSGSSESTDSQSPSAAAISAAGLEVVYDQADTDTSWDSADSTEIRLEGNTVSISGSGAAQDGGTVVILSAGTYVLSGTLNDGQILVNTKDGDPVRLVLNGADITASSGAAIYAFKAEKTVVVLADGTENRLVSEGASDGEENGAALFSKSDLTVNGGGSLTVEASGVNGIDSKDGLKLLGGAVSVTADGDGVRGKDYVAARDVKLTVNAGEDAIQSNNGEDAGKGFVLMESGTFSLTAGADGIQAETGLRIENGDFTVTTGGGSANGAQKSSNNAGMGAPGGFSGSVSSSTADTPSAKGLKAGNAISVEGGTLVLDTADDAVHSDDSLSVSGGSLAIASGDDGMHADTFLAVSGGTINISKSYEGIESAAITLSGGTIHVQASDDGVNVAGGSDGSSVNGRPGQNNFSSSGNYNLTVTGGYIYVDSTGDGVDANGSITMTGGTLIVNGPTANDNGALDYDGSFQVTGGVVIAAGSSGMAQAPDDSSSQQVLSVTFTSTLSASTLVNIQDQSGANVLTFQPTKQFQTVVFCSPALSKGTTYRVSSGGTAGGEAKDGVFTGSYSGGTELASVTLSGVVTSYGSQSGGRGGMTGMPGGANGGFRP